MCVCVVCLFVPLSEDLALNLQLKPLGVVFHVLTAVAQVLQVLLVPQNVHFIARCAIIGSLERRGVNPQL